MGIELNEYEWADQMIKNHDIGNKPTETLNRVARYYYENGYSKRDIRDMLDSFLVQCDPRVILVNWSNTLDRIVKGVGRYSLVKIDGINITQKELESVGTLPGKQIRRLAFTLLCVSKYWDNVSVRNDHWVNSSDKEIMQLANIRTSIQRQSLMFSKLREAGFIKFSRKVDNTNVRVLFGDSEGEPVLFIQDIRNLGYQYLKYCGESYFECCNCGIVTKLNNPTKGRRQKYCPACAVEVQTKQIVNSIMRQHSSNTVE